MNRISPTLLRQISLILLIFGLGFVLFYNMREWFPAVMGGYTLYMLMRRGMDYLTDRKRWPRALATSALMLLSFAVIFIPIQWVIGMLQTRFVSILQSPDLWNELTKAVHTIEVQYGLRLITPDVVTKISNWAIAEVSVLLSATLNSLLSVVIAYFVLFFLLMEGRALENGFFNFFPLKEENISFLKHETHTLVLSNAIGIPLLGILQGVSGLILYLIVGVQDPFLWFVITCIAGMMPILGVALAYIPLALIMVAQGMPLQGVIIMLYGFIVMGSVDNIARLWLQKKLGNVHPLITLFGVLLGLKLFGFIGFVFGPILISLFLLLIKLYTKEFVKDAQTTP